VIALVALGWALFGNALQDSGNLHELYR